MTRTSQLRGSVGFSPPILLVASAREIHGLTAWYLDREDDMGLIEVGKFAGLVVLDRDYFTVVGGKIVHNAGIAWQSSEARSALRRFDS
jgi:hypothetical protein